MTESINSIIHRITQIKSNQNSSGTYLYRRPMNLLNFKESGQYNFNNINSLRESEDMGNDFLTLTTIESIRNEVISMNVKFNNTNQSFYKVNFIQKGQLNGNLAFRIKNYYYTIIILPTTLVKTITQDERDVSFSRFFNDNYHNNRLVFSENFYLYLSSQIIENNSFKKDNRSNIIELFYSLQEVNFYIIYEGMNIYINGNLDEKSDELYYLIIGNIIYYFNSSLIFTKKQTMEDRDENKKDILYNYQFQYNFYNENRVINHMGDYQLLYTDINRPGFIDRNTFLTTVSELRVMIIDDRENYFNINNYRLYIVDKFIEYISENNNQSQNQHKGVQENLRNIRLFYNFFLEKYFIVYYGMNVYINENQNENSNELYFIIIDQYNKYYFNKDLVLTKKSLVFDNLFMVLEKHPYKRYNYRNEFTVSNGKVYFYYLDRKNRIIKNIVPPYIINGYNDTNIIDRNILSKGFLGEHFLVNNFYKIINKRYNLYQDLGLVGDIELYFNFEENSIFFIFDTENNQSKGNQNNEENLDIVTSIIIYITPPNRPYIPPYYIIIDEKKYYFEEIN